MANSRLIKDLEAAHAKKSRYGQHRAVKFCTANYLKTNKQ
jgi:hypothetical protein